LSIYFASLNSADEVRDTVLHELAHALAGKAAGHGPHWKAICLKIGARPLRCGANVVMPAGRWKAICPGCGRLHTRYRRPKHTTGYHCRPCGPVLGSLIWKHV
jgi:predicted SprT family Zn-dependent metalloprotease